MSQHPAAESREHEAITLLLPWYVNGTVSALDRQRVDAHVAACAACRNDLEFERRIHARVASDAVIEHIPAASLNRLQARLDDLESHATLSQRVTRKAHRPSLPWLGLMAASIAGAVVTVGFYTARGLHKPGDVSSPAYYTVTDPEPRPSNEVIRAVFVPTITLVELQALLDEAQLKIVSGPTEAGVYSLAAQSSRPVGLSLALLRQHQTVRFAEITQERVAKSKVDVTP
jgi:anti-sigma factor RsiW